MSEDNKSMEEIIAISYFDTDNMDIKNHVDRYFEIKRDIINVLNKYNVMWVLTDTNGFNNKDKEIERLNNIINELEKWLKYEINKSGFEQDYEKKSCYEDIFEELQELKGDESNGR